jgi:hypothetical protein
MLLLDSLNFEPLEDDHPCAPHTTLTLVTWSKGLENGKPVEPHPDMIPHAQDHEEGALPTQVSILHELSWRPLYDYLCETDQDKKMLLSAHIEVDPARVFLDGNLLQYVGDFEAKKEIESKKEFFE